MSWRIEEKPSPEKKRQEEESPEKNQLIEELKRNFVNSRRVQKKL
jgi:hypothetical protein